MCLVPEPSQRHSEVFLESYRELRDKVQNQESSKYKHSSLTPSVLSTTMFYCEPFIMMIIWSCPRAAGDQQQVDCSAELMVTNSWELLLAVEWQNLAWFSRHLNWSLLHYYPLVMISGPCMTAPWPLRDRWHCRAAPHSGSWKTIQLKITGIQFTGAARRIPPSHHIAHCL